MTGFEITIFAKIVFVSDLKFLVLYII